MEDFLYLHACWILAFTSRFELEFMQINLVKKSL